MAEAKLAWNPHYPFSMTVLDRGSKMLTELLVSSCEAEDELLTHQSDSDSVCFSVVVVVLFCFFFLPFGLMQIVLRMHEN